MLISSNRPTNQSGGATQGAGGSGNAVNGFYSQSAVDAAAKPWLAFASATPASYDGAPGRPAGDAELAALHTHTHTSAASLHITERAVAYYCITSGLLLPVCMLGT